MQSRSSSASALGLRMPIWHPFDGRCHKSTTSVQETKPVPGSSPSTHQSGREWMCVLRQDSECFRGAPVDQPVAPYDGHCGQKWQPWRFPSGYRLTFKRLSRNARFPLNSRPSRQPNPNLDIWCLVREHCVSYAKQRFLLLALAFLFRL